MQVLKKRFGTPLIGVVFLVDFIIIYSGANPYQNSQLTSYLQAKEPTIQQAVVFRI